MVHHKDMQNIRAMLSQDNADDYEVENPREKVDFAYFGDESSYLEKKNLPPIKVYIYGNYPHFEKATAYFMLRKAGVNFTNKYDKNSDIGWFWDARIELNKKSQKVREQSKDLRFLNLFLIDTSKDFVAKSMQNYFGYTFKIDPKKYDGYCVAKHNGNGTKSCFFLKCPIDADEVFHDHCYQKIINFSSKTDPNTLYEIRIPIFKNIIPFTFFKKRNRGLRFTSKNRSMEITPAISHLSAPECQQILSYCRRVGLEYGEIDILRDDKDGKIYIIDINNTPWWPPNKLSDIDRNISLNMMWNAWLEAFLPDKYPDYHIPDEYLDDFVNHKKPEKNNRERRQINSEEYKFTGKDYDFPYKDLWRELYKKNLSNKSKPQNKKPQNKNPENKKPENKKSNNKKSDSQKSSK